MPETRAELGIGVRGGTVQGGGRITKGTKVREHERGDETKRVDGDRRAGYQGLKPMAIDRGPVGARFLDGGGWLAVHQGLKPVAIDRSPVGLVDCMVGLKLGVQAFVERELYHGGAVD